MKRKISGNADKVPKGLLLEELVLNQEYKIHEVEGEWVGELDLVAWSPLKEIAAAVAEVSMRVCDLPANVIRLEAYLRPSGLYSVVGFHIFLSPEIELTDEIKAVRANAVLRFLFHISRAGGPENMTLNIEALPPEVEQIVLEIAKAFLEKYGDKSVSPSIWYTLGRHGDETSDAILSGRLAAKPTRKPSEETWTIHGRFDGAFQHTRDCALIQVEPKSKVVILKFPVEKLMTDIYPRLYNGKTYPVTYKEVSKAKGILEFEIVSIGEMVETTPPKDLKLEPIDRDAAAAGGKLKRLPSSRPCKIHLSHPAAMPNKPPVAG